MEQSEQFFMALNRLGKKAKHVRYWGEGHGLRSPANIRDMWQQIFSWLEETGVPPGPVDAAPAANPKALSRKK